MQTMNKDEMRGVLAKGRLKLGDREEAVVCFPGYAQGLEDGGAIFYSRHFNPKTNTYTLCENPTGPLFASQTGTKCVQCDIGINVQGRVAITVMTKKGIRLVWDAPATWFLGSSKADAMGPVLEKEGGNSWFKLARKGTGMKTLWPTDFVAAMTEAEVKLAKECPIYDGDEVEHVVLGSDREEEPDAPSKAKDDDLPF
jgi:hypothetical protein